MGGGCSGSRRRTTGCCESAARWIRSASRR
jgi:hypothetical protein